MEIGSRGWCEAMSRMLAGVELPDVRATMEQRIGDGNGGPVIAYRLVIDGGRAHLEPASEVLAAGGASNDGGNRGASDDDGSDDGSGSDGSGVVVMSQSRNTAEAVRRGELGALSALQAGLIKVSGDVQVLIVAAEALAAVDAALSQALAGSGFRINDEDDDEDDDGPTVASAQDTNNDTRGDTNNDTSGGTNNDTRGGTNNDTTGDAVDGES